MQSTPNNQREHRIVNIIRNLQDTKQYQELHWEGSFTDYLEIVKKHPEVTRNAFKRIFDMILSYGTEAYTKNRETLIRYKFFDDPLNGGEDAIFGLEKPIIKIMNLFQSAAKGYGTEKRLFLLHGPIGSSKSTIVRLLKHGLEAYSKTPEGALYSFAWRVDHEDGNVEYQDCPMHEEPLHLIPVEFRSSVISELCRNRKIDFQIQITGELCPFCRQHYKELNLKYRGDWTKIINNVKVKRLILSEKSRIGIGTFQPKDEKNQDSTELTGDINYRKIAIYGSDSDPRAFNFDGELNIANRGLVEFIEILKLEVAFLYDLLGASQEHKIKPKKFAQPDIDEVIIGHTNEPEYRKLQTNEYMEALRDRMVKIDVPYITRLKDEI